MRVNWLVRLLIATIVVAMSGISAGAGLAVADDPLGGYPLVVQVNLDHTDTCSGPLRGTASVYFPPGEAIGSEIEWRVRVGDRVLRTDRMPIRGNVATGAFELAATDVAPGEDLLVDARAVGPLGFAGSFGKPWHTEISRSCAPLHVVSVGDSGMWGQGLDQNQKFSYLTAERLGAATGRGFVLHDYSMSGAVLDAPDIPPGNNDSACLSMSYRQDIDGRGTMAFGEVTDQIPDVFCQLEKAAANATADGYTIDLVLVQGCINDLDPFFGIPLGLTPGSADLPAAIQRECGGTGAAAVNPARDFPLPSGAKRGYGGRGMRAALEKAHDMPGRPKVLAADYWYTYDPTGLPEQFQRQGEFVRRSAEVFRTAAEEANAASADGPFAVAADGLFTFDNALGGRDPKTWQTPFSDNAIALRALACPQLSELPPQCLVAAITHPDVAGARQYADAFLLNPALRRYFGLGSPQPAARLTVTRDSGPRNTPVTLQVSGTGERYDWYFGDGTRETTTESTVTHAYPFDGPNMPRVVITAADGAQALVEAAQPIVIG